MLLNLTRNLPQLNMTAPARIPVRAWDGGHPVAAEESTIVFMDGYHAQGALDKAHFGATAFGMVHVRDPLRVFGLADLSTTTLTRGLPFQRAMAPRPPAR